MKKKKAIDVYIENRKARYDYEFLEKWTAGIVLSGPEVKAIREGRASLVDAYCFFAQYELWMHGVHITPLREGDFDPKQHRKLLLKKKELNRISRDLVEGMTVVVTKLFTVNGRIKAEIALARGKKTYDKRETIKKRDVERELRRS